MCEMRPTPHTIAGPPPFGNAKNSTDAIDGRSPMIEKAMPKTCMIDYQQLSGAGMLSTPTSRAVKALLNSCLYPSSAKSASSLRRMASREVEPPFAESFTIFSCRDRDGTTEEGPI